MIIKIFNKELSFMNFNNLAGLSVSDYFLGTYLLFFGWYLITRLFQWKYETMFWYYLSAIFSTIAAITIDLLFVYYLVKNMPFSMSVFVFLVAFFSTWESIVLTIAAYEENIDYFEDAVLDENDARERMLQEALDKDQQPKETTSFGDSLSVIPIEENEHSNGSFYLINSDRKRLEYDFLDTIYSDGKEFLVLRLKEDGPSGKLQLLCRQKVNEDYIYIQANADTNFKIFDIYYEKHSLNQTDNNKAPGAT